jgi:ribosomal protein S28E/S33
LNCKRYRNYGRNPSRIVKRYGKGGIKVGSIVNWSEKYGRKKVE